MSSFTEVREDLAAEQADLDAMIEGLDELAWSRPTPAAGWDVRDQVAHLTYFDGTAALAISDPEGFADGVARLIEGAGSVGVDEYTLGSFRKMPITEVLELWRMNRTRLERAAAGLEESARIPWYGPSMGATSFLTARLMECWAHGTDIADALGITRRASERLRHICRLGYNTRAWSYTVRGLEVPPEAVRVAVTGPAGEEWVFGEESARESVTGTALDFCLVVTQRRHVEDTTLHATPVARHWLERAQAFAGGPTTGPAPRSRG